MLMTQSASYALDIRRINRVHHGTPVSVRNLRFSKTAKYIRSARPVKKLVELDLEQNMNKVNLDETPETPEVESGTVGRNRRNRRSSKRVK